MRLFTKYEYQDTLKARLYADSSLIWAKMSENDAIIGDAYRIKGWYYQDRSKFDLAINNFILSRNYLKKAGKKQGVADAYGNLGNAHYDKGDFQRCLDMQLISLRMNEEILANAKTKEERSRADEGKAYALHNIGDIYAEIGLFQKAFEYTFQSLKHDLRVHSDEGVAISYNTIATLFKKTNQTDSAEYYFREALKLHEKNPQPYEYGTALIEFSTLDGAHLTIEERSKMARKALRIRREMADADSEASTLIAISRYFFDDLSVDSLSGMLERAFFLIEDGDLDDLRSDYFKVYSRYSMRLGDFKGAYFALEDYLELKAFADAKQRDYDIIAGGIKYQVEHEFRQDSLRQENQFATERNKYLEDISEIQDIVYLSVIGFLLLIASLVYYVSSNRRRKKMNGLLVEKNQIVEQQKGLVEERNKSISDSINYARRLQAAILPTPDQINEYIPDSFLIFEPKDVVSGDFYWFETKGDLSFLAVADCTGHGVPGAMVSVVCSNAINRSVNEFNLKSPKEILNKTREIVIETFAKSGDVVSDGMDISLIAINFKEKKIIFSGAHNALWIVRGNDQVETISEEVNLLKTDQYSLLEWKGDKQPIGRFHNIQSFIQHEIKLSSGDQVYLMSDGFVDQFGGPSGKKFKSIPLKRLILENASKPMKVQKETFANAFFDWKGDQDQIDDVCMIGFRL